MAILHTYIQSQIKAVYFCFNRGYSERSLGWGDTASNPQLSDTDLMFYCFYGAWGLEVLGGH